MAYIQDWGMRVQAQPQINTTRRAFLHLSQNENGRMLNIRITDVNIPTGSTAVLAGTKPDGTVYSQAGTLSGNTATFAEDVQMTAVAGTWDAKITVTNGGNCICTARITITVDPDTVAGGAIPSDSQLDGIIAECRAIADSVRKEAYGSPLVADAVEDMTDQSRVYVYTGSESGMTAGHWYYYNGTTWTDGGVYNAVAVDTDTTLTIAGKAADAKKVGDELADVKEDFTDIAEASNNLFDGNVVNLGFSSGKVASDPTYRAFYWPVSNGETYTLSRRNTTDFNRFRVGFTRELPATGVLVYKEDGTQFTPTSEGDSLTAQTVTVPDRFEFEYAMVYLSNSGQTIDDSCKLMINKGSTALEWEVYFAKTAVDRVAREKIAEFDGNVGIIQRNGIAETTNKLQQLNRPTRTGGHTLGTAPLCLLHFSDIHGDKKRLQNIIDFKNYYADYITDIIHTGDAVKYYSTDGIDFWNEVEGAENILNVIGNHDTLVGSTWIGMTMAEAYTTYFAPYIGNWGVVSTSGKTYYYKDYTDNKVRIIVLDIMHQSADQLTWFTNTLASARTANLHVIVAVHSRAHWLFDSYVTPFDDKPLVPSYTAGYSDTSASTYPENLSDDYADAVDDFMDGGGYFVCWIHGHTHHKMFAELQTHPNQLDVSVENAGIPNFAWTYVKARIENTKSEDCFNVIGIDTDSKVLRIMTVGATYDRFMRHVDGISYNYETHTLLT